jgi:ATP-dependent DNA helicase RecQ
MSALQKLLKKHWGFDALRPLQQQAVDAILRGKDVRVLLPTGGGKSLCYQLPAVCEPGLAIVVSPLISLMQDQVEQLKKRNVKAMHLSGSLGIRTLDERLTSAANGGYKLLYVSPERLQAEWILERFSDMQISFIAVDEAHCISQWGYDFRPSYLAIKKLRGALPDLPIMALTASATAQVLSDIEKELELRNPLDVRDSFFRTNLGIHIIETERREARCLSILKQTRGTAIIYLRSRKGTEVFAKFLRDEGIAAAAYHAGMEPEIRQEVQSQWMRNKTRVMVATTAFGMGIDKPDVRFVIHFGLPDSPESYYQEIGRAGRDGKRSQCILLYTRANVKKLSQSQFDEPDINEIRKIYTAFFSQEQIAIGAGQYAERPIHLYSFSNKYGFSSRHVHQAFSLLDRMHFVRYEDVSKRPSVFRFLAQGNELYAFFTKNPSLEPVGKAILRLYGGITTYATDISEELLSRKTGYPVKRVIKHLEILAKRNIAFYKKRYQGTTLTLLTDRVPENQLNVQAGFLKMRKEGKKRRADAMIQLAENNVQCRMQQLVAYFNESTDRQCGLCDVCKKEKNSQLAGNIIALLKQDELSIESISEKLPHTSPKKLGKLIKLLHDQGKIDISDAGVISLI